MTRYFSYLALSTLALIGSTTQAHALRGGPFDNGFPSSAIDSNAIYQSVLTFRNGNGFCYFTPEQLMTSERVPGGTSNVTDYDSRGSLSNRAVIYYEGITYIGSAFGMADPADGYVQCTLNGGSEMGFSATGTTGTGATATTTTSISEAFTISGKNFTVNGNWTAKFNKVAPTLRFVGKGELAFLSPTGSDAVANLALQAYTDFIGAINSYYSNAVGVGIPATFFLQGQNAIASALSALGPFLSAGGVEQTGEDVITAKVRVRGTLRYP